jgi:hypothetical protein
MFPEWTNWAALYGTVKVKQFQVNFVRSYLDEVKGDSFFPIAIATTYSAGLITPASINVVIDNGDSQLWPVFTDHSGGGRMHSFKFPGLAWATTSTPNPGSSTGAQIGCPGGVLVYAASLPTSITVATIQIIGTYLLRLRT